MKQITSKEFHLISHNFQVRFALFCANQVRNVWKGIPECVEAIRMAELWLEDKATSKECEVAAYAASAAASAAAAYASSAAAYATYAAASAASAAASAASAAYAASAASAASAAAYASEDKAKLIKEQWAFYNELLNFDEIVEKALLGACNEKEWKGVR